MISLYEVSFTMKSLVDLQETTLNHEVSKYMIGSAHQMEFFIYLYDINPLIYNVPKQADTL